jgi:CRP-like cAMP-binding protein
MEQLLRWFDAIKSLSPELRSYLETALKPMKVKKGDIILQEGKIARYIYFIEEGLVRSFKYIDGHERTGWIMKTGDIIVSVRSFFSQTPAKETIEALEPCLLHYISFNELKKAYDVYPEFDRHGRIITTHYYVLSEERNEMREQPEAKDKFEFLMNNQPELIGKVLDKHLASYLGMSPEHFSQQKSNFKNQGKQK